MKSSLSIIPFVGGAFDIKNKKFCLVQTPKIFFPF